MQSSWNTFGHSHIKLILDKQLQKGIFPHAFLFSGAEGVGKKTLALEFAQKVLGTQNLQTNPDFQILDQEGPISVETIREFVGSLSFKPFISKKKIAIINNAQNLNTQSGNALLKTLEEPSASTILILISATSGLLPTIVSRCQNFVVNGFSISQLAEYAEQNKLKATPEIIQLSFGSIARLQKLTSNPAILEKQRAEVLEFKKIKESILADRLVAVDSFGLLETEELEKKFLSWLLWAVSELLVYPTGFKMVSALTEALEGLKINKNKKLVLQGLFLSL